MIKIEGSRFLDEHGRSLLLRGVNVGGSNKVPIVPLGATHLPGSLKNPAEASFVGRPFPAQEADLHFKRLKRWGFRFLRFLVTWEAVEHEGAGRYDKAYLDYVEEVVAKAGEHGLQLFIDPHQDVWSRFTGGDGAPGWTLESAGFDLASLHRTGAAFLHQEHSGEYPRMLWPTNGTKLAAATMFTLFFGGRDFAPSLKVDGESIQDFLQGHYIRSIGEIAKRLRKMDHVVGYDTLNEPVAGWIGWEDLNKTGGILRLGPTPTPLEAMALGEGAALPVADYRITLRGLQPKGKKRLNADGLRAWQADRSCVWKNEGVWEMQQGKPRILRPDHFSMVNGRKVSFTQDYFLPFAKRYLTEIRKQHADSAIFVETEAAQPPPTWPEAASDNVVFAPHWYDALLLMTKKYLPYAGVDFRTEKPVFGKRTVRRSFNAQLQTLKSYGARLGGVPILIGEFGIPFDLDNGRAFRTGDFRTQGAALHRTFKALDDNLLSGTLWNYTPDNTNSHGDGWNGEDLSIYSHDQAKQDDHPDDGARALAAFARPYPYAIPGKLLEFAYSPTSGRFQCLFKLNENLDAPAIMVVPASIYDKVEILSPHGDARYDREAGELVYVPDKRFVEHEIVFLPL